MVTSSVGSRVSSCGRAYSIADILAKAASGLAIYKVARVKSRLEDPADDDELTGLVEKPDAATTDGAAPVR